MEMNNWCNAILQCLDEVQFPNSTSRKNVSDKPVQAFALGYVPYRGIAYARGKPFGESKFNLKFDRLYATLNAFMKWLSPEFKYTTIQINKNVKCKPHTDRYNVGSSVLLAVGNFTGGELVIEGEKYKVKNKPILFNGKEPHWTTAFRGKRYSIIFFKHSRI